MHGLAHPLTTSPDDGRFWQTSTKNPVSLGMLGGGIICFFKRQPKFASGTNFFLFFAFCECFFYLLHDIYMYMHYVLKPCGVNRTNGCIFFIAHRMCLTHTNVCSPACVLKQGFRAFTFSGEYFVRQLVPTWFPKWKTSIIFSIFCQTVSRGGSKGNGFFWRFQTVKVAHIVICKVIGCGSLPHCFYKHINHCSNIRNT